MTPTRIAEAVEYFTIGFDPEYFTVKEIMPKVETLIAAAEQSQRAEVLVKCIVDAAICLLKSNAGIIDTVWMPEGNCTLYEHLVSHLDVKLTGDIDEDIKALAAWKGRKI